MFCPVFPLHSSGRFCPSAIPDACGPRKVGQLPFAEAARDEGRACDVSVIFRGGLVTTSPAGNQVLRSTIIRRGTQSSATTSNDTRLPSLLKRYFPGVSQPPGPPLIASSTSSPSVFQ